MDRPGDKFHKPIVYQIKVRGRLKGKWSNWLNGRVVEFRNDGEGSNATTIRVSVPDQAALRGVLNKIWDLNLTLLSVNLYKDEVKIGGANED